MLPARQLISPRLLVLRALAQCSASGSPPPLAPRYLLETAPATTTWRVTDDGPDPVPPPAEPPIHPFTGKFADAEQAVAYWSKAFRMMMPLHIVATALMIVTMLFIIASDASTGSAASDVVATKVAVTAMMFLGLGARVAVHRWEDKAKAQHVGATAWTLTVVLTFASGCTACSPDCSSIRSATWIIGYALFALINATHGMEFWHTTSLVGLMLCDLVRARFLCGDLLALNLAIMFVLIVHAFCHFQALLNRHAFLETDYLHVSRERLEYDFKRLEAGLQRLAPRLPADACEQAGGSVPSESSDSTSTATGQGARSTQSAPGAMVGRERRHGPEDVHRLASRPPAVACEQVGGSVPSESSGSTSTATGQGARSTQSALSAPGAMVGRERRHVPEDVHRHSLPPRPSITRCAGAAQPNAPSSANGHASKPTRRCSWSAETLARVSAGTSSAPSASSSTGRSARRRCAGFVVNGSQMSALALNSPSGSGTVPTLALN